MSPVAKLLADIDRLRAANVELAAALKAAEFELHDRQCRAPRLAATLEGARAALDKHQQESA